jgi:hypothetical protein
VQVFLVTDEEIQNLSIYNLLIQEQEGQGSEEFEARSVVLLHEHREDKTDEEIRCSSINKQKNRMLDQSTRFFLFFPFNC